MMKRLILRCLPFLSVVLLLIVLQGCTTATEKEPQVKNIILMIGDGMGLTHVSALMIENEYRPINMERLPVGGFVKTYSLNNRVTDSAASGTAYSTGHKTYNSYVGMDTLARPLKTILEKAEERGMATGLVVTVRIQHATPAVFYAHTLQRYSEEELSLDLMDSGVDVAIGGGMCYLMPENRKDGRDLRSEFEQKGYLMTDSLSQLDGISEGMVMSLVEMNCPLMTNGRNPLFLSAATGKALEILTNNSKGNGFFLMVEGSHIDTVSHLSDTESTLKEVRDFDDAVGVAMDYAEAHPGTLLIVLADHETGGLSIPSNNVDFLRADSGIGFNWGTRGHTGTMVPLFAYGPCAEYFGGVLENDEVGRRMQKVLGLW